MPRSNTPENLTRQALAISSHYASDLAFDQDNGLGVLEIGHFGAYLAARIPAVYASWSRSPVYILTTTQDSLPT